MAESDDEMYYLSKEDVIFLRSLREGQRDRRKISSDSYDEAPGPSPEIYVAKSVTGAAIAARVTTTVLSQMCYIYRLIEGSPTTITPVLMPDAVTQKQLKVYNISPTSIPGDTYIRITRDKYGRWIAETSSTPPGGLFPITLTQTGGAAGSSTVQTSWTYTVNHGYTGVELATAVNPTASPHLYRREAVGKLIAAVAGVAFYNSSDELVIIDIREPLDASEC